MPTKTITLPPGVDTQKTRASNSGGYSASNLIRWREGLLERMDGWERLFDAQCDGFVRAIHAYQDLSSTNTLLLGTDAGTQIYTEESGLIDTTLGRRAATLPPPIYSATSGSSLATVTDPAHGASNGDILRVPYALYGNPDNTAFRNRYTGDWMSDAIWVASLGLYVAIGNSAGPSSTTGILTSPDGLNWTPRAAPIGANMFRIAWSGSELIATSYTATSVLRSTNGTTWTAHTFGFAANTFGVVYGAGAWLAWTNNGVVNLITSTTGGTTWTNNVIGAVSPVLFDIAYNNSRFVGVGNSNTIATSTTPTGWSTVTSAAPGGTGLYSVAWSPTLALWCVVGTGGTIQTSPDGINWTLRTSGVSTTLETVRWDGVQFIVVGSSVALSSRSGVNWYPMVPEGLSLWRGVAGASTAPYTVIAGQNPGLVQTLKPPTAFTTGSLTLPENTYTISAVTTNTYQVAAPATPTVTSTLGGWPRLYAVNPVGISSSQYARVYASGHGMTVGDTFSPDIDVSFPNNGVVLSKSTSYPVVATPNAYTFEINMGVTPTTILTEAYYENGSFYPEATLQYFQQVPTQPRNWFLDNFGEYGVFVPENGAVYIYTPPIPANGLVLAEIISTGPQINAGMFVAMPQAQIMCFGSEATLGGGVQDPLLVRWCDAGDYTAWTATSTNQAGSFRLSRGSKIVGGVQAPQTSLLWTDIDIWSAQYIGPSLVYGFQMIGSGCGLIAPKARCVQSRNTYWMSTRGFYMFGDSGVQPMVCPVWDIIFGRLDVSQTNKIHAGSNSSTHEIMFFYPSTEGGGEIDSYVKYNVQAQAWDYGSLVRTAWYDQSVWGTALGADENFRIQQHEMGYNADGEAMEGAFIETGYTSIAEGDIQMFIDLIMPDTKFLGEDGSITISALTKRTPQEDPVTHGPFSITDETSQLPIRARARLVAFRFDWVPSLGYNARLGAPRLRVAPAGRAP